MRYIMIIICLFYSTMVYCRIIIVDKSNLKLYVYDKSEMIFSAPICAGINMGNKTSRRDGKTPEGMFTISQIQNSAQWTHDFHDGQGQRKGAYGPWFLRLKTPRWTSIGIHGTCFPESIGKRESEGCIRLKNDDLLRLMPLVEVGMSVVILRDNVQ